ncbi:MAG: conserved rane protein of unknown function [Rhizobium sp.]|nr:conserved rane protein of unknown function [Rhizobium sp.]
MLQRQISRAPRYLAIGIITFAVAAAIGLAILGLPIDSLPFQLKNKDFTNYWMAGQLALNGNGPTLFGRPTDYFEAMKAIFGADYPWHNWSYPPHAALLLLPLGVLGYLPGMAIFLGFTLALYVLSLQSLRPNWTPIAVILLLPFLAGNLVSTQNGFLTTALLVGGLALRDRRPVFAGILFGVLTFKPQLGLLLPILLLYERRWMVIATATITAIALILSSILAFGIQSWTDYFRYIAPYQTEIMNTFGGDFPHMMGSAFGSARSLGFDAAQAIWVHMPFAVAGFGLFLFSLWRLEDIDARSFALLIAGMLIVPYSVAYDFGALATFAALWPFGNDKRQPGLPLRLALILVAILPIGMLPMGQAGLPLTPAILLGAFVALLTSEGAFRFNGTSSSPAKPSRMPQG